MSGAGHTPDMAAFWASDLPSILTEIVEAENGGRPAASASEGEWDEWLATLPHIARAKGGQS